MVLCPSCTDKGYGEAKIFYANNSEILNNMVQKMLFDKDYTYILIEENGNHNYNISIEKIDSNYLPISINGMFKNSELDTLVRNYYLKLGKSSNIELTSLKSFLLWMISNRISIIRVKTPEFNYLTVKLSQKTGIRFDLSHHKSPDILTMDPIENNWFYVVYQ